MKNIFTPEISSEIINRINQLDASKSPQWGKMSADQMLAHCNVTYEMVYEPEKHSKPNAFTRFILKTFVKKAVISEKPYKRNGQTAPQFLITDQRNFEKEKDRLITYIEKTKELGENHFEGKESHSFGVLTKNEWNNMFYKHLDHHLNQFAV